MGQNTERKETCLVCKNAANSSRGLCVSHYLQFTRIRKDLIEKGQEDKAIAWEKHLIETGRLLPSVQGKKAKDNVFSDDLQDFLASSESQSDMINQEADKIGKIAKKHATKEAALKPVKAKKKQG